MLVMSVSRCHRAEAFLETGCFAFGSLANLATSASVGLLDALNGILPCPCSFLEMGWPRPRTRGFPSAPIGPFLGLFGVGGGASFEDAGRRGCTKELVEAGRLLSEASPLSLWRPVTRSNRDLLGPLAPLGDLCDTVSGRDMTLLKLFILGDGLEARGLSVEADDMVDWPSNCLLPPLKEPSRLVVGRVSTGGLLSSLLRWCLWPGRCRRCDVTIDPLGARVDDDDECAVDGGSRDADCGMP